MAVVAATRRQVERAYPQMTQITQMGFAFRSFGIRPEPRREKTSVSSVAPWWVLSDKAMGRQDPNTEYTENC
jgi:hypothetical protein